jgi:hypothetical protein
MTGRPAVHAGRALRRRRREDQAPDQGRPAQGDLLGDEAGVADGDHPAGPGQRVDQRGVPGVEVAAEVLEEQERAAPPNVYLATGSGYQAADEAETFRYRPSRAGIESAMVRSI